MERDTHEDVEQYNSGLDVQEKKPMTLRRLTSFVGLIVLLGGVLWLFAILKAPVNFPVGQRVEIPFGTSLRGSAQILEQQHVIRSSFLLQFILIANSGEEGVKAGIYQFDRPTSMLEIARAVTSGTNGIPLVRVTIPEGLRNTEIDVIIRAALPAIAPGTFEKAAAGKEGYLFPETYHVSETFTTEQFVALMEDTFTEKIAPLQTALDTSARSKEDIIIMASILEREGDSEESMGLISGILWKRLDAGIPLQVDASFSYLLGKSSKDVTLDDLKLDSPYNTYKYKGLPPTPINNPGLQAIKAALSPTPSPYLYYLTAADGTFHYAKTFEEHKKNKVLFLN